MSEQAGFQAPVNTTSMVYDRARALERLGGDEELFDSIVELLIEDVPQQVAALSQEVANGDAIAAGKMAHAIKGAVANFCADAATESARKIEVAGKAGNLAAVQAELPELKKAIETLLTALNAPGR